MLEAAVSGTWPGAKPPALPLTIVAKSVFDSGNLFFEAEFS